MAQWVKSLYDDFMKLMILLILTLSSGRIFAGELICNVNIAPAEKTVTRDKIKDFIYPFKVDLSSAKGTNVQFKNVQLIMWGRGDDIHLHVKNLTNEMVVKTSFDMRKRSIKLTMSPHIEISCLQEVSLKNSNVDSVTNILHQKITDETDLVKLDANVNIILTKKIMFFYKTQNPNGKMRPIIYQNGQSKQRDQVDFNDNFCVFQIQLKRDENTVISSGTKFVPISFSKNKNNEKSAAYVYSFVDFSSGKKTQETNRYAPFSLECSLKRGLPFNYKMFKFITGSDFKFTIKK